MSLTVISPKGSSLVLEIKELWQFRELFYFFSWRDIKVKYKQTVLGLLWLVLQPLIMMIIFTFFFSRALGVHTDSMPYPVFCFTGLLFWNFFSSGLVSAGNSMVSNSNIIKKIYFPRLIIPISSIIVALFDFLITILIYALVLIYFKFPPSVKTLFCFPIAFYIVLQTTLGMGFLLAALNVKYRDFRYVIPFMIQILLFVTPVIYSLSLVDNELLKFVFGLNPIASAIQLARAGVLGAPIMWGNVLTGLIISLSFLLFGFYFFRSVENEFADIV
jgi:lipopolysaccharide transport system permease protein